MSYYNYIFKPLKTPFVEGEAYNSDDYLEFYESDKGFDNLRKFLGDEYVHHYQGVKYIHLKEVNGGSDYIRPRDLDMNLTNCDRQVYINDPDCCVLVSDMHNRIDWSKVKDIDSMEKALKCYQDLQVMHQEPLLVYPL